MSSANKAAHRAGIIYFVFMLVSIAGEFFFPAFAVRGDAAATARNLASHEFAYRLAILVNFATLVIFIFLVECLYELFADVDRRQSRLMVLLVMAGIGVAFASLLNRFIPIAVMSEAASLSAFSPSQQAALMLGGLRFRALSSAVALGFWGLWLFPFGTLVVRSRYFPRILGWLLMVAGAGYAITSVTAILFPEWRGPVSRVMTPLYIGEVPIIFWLMIKGAAVPGDARDGVRAHSADARGTAVP